MFIKILGEPYPKKKKKQKQRQRERERIRAKGREKASKPWASDRSTEGPQLPSGGCRPHPTVLTIEVAEATAWPPQSSR